MDFKGDANRSYSEDDRSSSNFDESERHDSIKLSGECSYLVCFIVRPRHFVVELTPWGLEGVEHVKPPISKYCFLLMEDISQSQSLSSIILMHQKVLFSWTEIEKYFCKLFLVFFSIK